MEQIIIYGAGSKGKAYLKFMQECGLEDLVAFFCDARANEIDYVDSIPVIDYEKAKATNYRFLLGVRKEYKKEIVDRLNKDGKCFYYGLDELIVNNLKMMSRTEFERKMCAIAHIESMDDYFTNADSEGKMRFFWSEGKCRDLFDRLDISNVVELACGRGRHVPQYIDRADHVTLVDVLEKNIDICRERFAGQNKIFYVVNNGKDLSVLHDSEYTALFTYDSMVHFELLDVASYLSETYRILVPGGRALFHHSNNDSDYKASYDDALEARSFMNKDIFAYLAYRAGFEIEEQYVFDWVVPNLDCLTLVVKR